MAQPKIVFDMAALQEHALRIPEVQAALAEAAEQTAANVRDQGIRVGDQDGGRYEIDLPVATEVLESSSGLVALVTLMHPAGLAVQAKHGALTSAAAQAGLKVTGGEL